MEGVKEPIGVGMKIKCFIDAGLQNQISRASLVTILDEMASTHDGSKEVIRVLLEVLYSKHGKHDNITTCTPEPQSKGGKIPESKETQTEEINLDEIEFPHDDTIDYIDMVDETEEMTRESIKVKEASPDETSLDQQDDKISSFEANDINEDIFDDEYYNLATSSINSKSKRAKLECLICVKTFKYRIQLNKHMKSHDNAVEGVIESDEINKDGEKNVNSEPTIAEEILSQSTSNLQADPIVKSEIVDKEMPINVSTKSLQGLGVQSKPFFYSHWRGKSRGGWLTVLIYAPYQYTPDQLSRSGVQRFKCNGCRSKSAYAYAYGKVTGYGECGMPEYELMKLENDHACEPKTKGYTSFLNRVLLNRYDTFKTVNFIFSVFRILYYIII